MNVNVPAIRYPRPTAQVEPYVKVLGHALAITFLLQFGGVETYFRKTPLNDSDLVGLIGYDNAKALGAMNDRLPRRVPSAKSWIAACLTARGDSIKQIALTLKVSDTTVRNDLTAKGG